MTLAAIAFGVSGLVLSGGFVRDIYYQLGELLIHSQSGHIQIMPQGYFSAGAGTPEKYLIENRAQVDDAVRSLPAVKDVMARVAFSGLLNNGRSDWAIRGEGVEPDKEARLGSHLRIVEGRHLTDADVDGILIGRGVARALKLVAGDRVTLMLNTRDGSLNTLDFEVTGIFQSFSKDFDARAVRINLRAAHELLAASGVNTFVLSLENTDAVQPVALALKRNLQNSSLEVHTWKELNDFYEKTVALYDRQFGVLQLIILLMVVLSVSNSVNMSIFERLGEFGTMRAVGNRSGMVFRLILTESLLVGAIGASIGALLGVLLALTISAIGIPMPPPPNSDLGFTARIQLSVDIVSSAFSIGLAATFLASLAPALRVSRTSIVDALRHNV